MTAAANTPETTLVGIDVGGTFTDFVVLQEGRLRIHKVPTTPDDQSRAIVAGLQELDIAAAEIVHGMTVATNALLERRGARTALLTTAGFGDVLVIGRQNRPHIYALHQTRPPALVDDAWRLGLVQRRGDLSVAMDWAADMARLAPLSQATMAKYQVPVLSPSTI